MSEKRSVSTDALETLGNIITGGGRDAIHLAVEPVIAGQTLRPGDHVGLENNKAVLYAKKLLGIVDPFLNTMVKPGEMFWLVVYPRQITSLRHVWEHPDFPSESQEIEDTTMTTVLLVISSSKKWISEYAESVGISTVTLMEAAKNWLDTHEHTWGNGYLNLGGLLEGEYVPDEFWDHYENVTGRIVSESDRGNFFSCSC